MLSVFDDAADLGSSRYDPAAWCVSRHYVHRTRTGDLDVTVWTYAGTAWVCLRGLMTRRAAHALTTLLLQADVADIVLDTTELTLPTARGGSPLISLCASLSNAGYSVAAVGDDGRPGTGDSGTEVAGGVRLAPPPGHLVAAGA